MGLLLGSFHPAPRTLAAPLVTGDGRVMVCGGEGGIGDDRVTGRKTHGVAYRPPFSCQFFNYIFPFCDSKDDQAEKYESILLPISSASSRYGHKLEPVCFINIDKGHCITTTIFFSTLRKYLRGICITMFT